MFIIILNYKKPLEVVEQHLAAHRTFLEEGYNKNYFLASGPKNPRTGGIIVSQLTDKSLLEKIIADDPFNIHDVADYEIIEFEPVKYHAEFSSFINSARD